jgi:hypothetical protein
MMLVVKFVVVAVFMEMGTLSHASPFVFTQIRYEDEADDSWAA